VLRKLGGNLKRTLGGLLDRGSYDQRLGLFRDLWCVDHAEVSDRTFEIRGWAVTRAGDPSAVSFTLNGRPFDEVEYPLDRPDIERIYQFLPHARQSGFICRAAIAPDRAFTNGRADLHFASGGDVGAASADQDYFVADRALDPAPLPDGPRMVRVHGAAHEMSFRLEGFSELVKLERVLQRRFGRAFESYEAILDWGCGCGRVSRFLERTAAGRLTGADIDADNVSWCRRNLAFGAFHVIPLHPPTAFKNETFDLVFGISVFTHLAEQEQRQWLAELRRIVRPGGTLLLTVHGMTTALRSGLPWAAVAAWQAAGIYDLPNPALNGVIDEAGYYRNTFHTTEYIARTWTSYFELLEIVPGYIGNNQDLVVLTRI
jgi:SAM-dependent methyltransferase